MARAYRVQAVYRDVEGHRRRASPEALVAVLRALGAPLDRPEQAPSALREQQEQCRRRWLEPVSVVWSPGPAGVKLLLPGRAEGRLECCLKLENGEETGWTVTIEALPLFGGNREPGRELAARRLPLPAVPWGYHHLEVRWSNQHASTRLVVAPRQAFRPQAGEREWGVFIPLYALSSARSWGVGDFSDLAALLSWVRSLGGALVGTLPLLAAFLDHPFDPSPYVPVSRLFWNELYVDVTRAPEFAACPEAQELVASEAFRRERAEIAASALVDYRRVMSLKRRVLEKLVRQAFAPGAGGLAELAAWMARHPRVRDYARFRAAVERQGRTWPSWPQRLREGTLVEGDFDPEAERYHLYGQWLAERQLNELLPARGGAGLYLDLPLGVHPHGYDVWREREVFVSGVSCGAPPDPFFRRGQNWGIPPLHPEGLRERGYEYFLACLRHHLRVARVLRLDHVMGLHRLFWIPEGLEAREGVYVRYRPEEFYALLALESHRHRAWIVGEDLGLLPRGLRRALRRHGLLGMYVGQFEWPFGHRPVPDQALACLNTHDTLPFAGFWQEMGPEARAALAERLLPPEEREEEPDPARVLAAAWRYLATRPAALLLINLEDLWLETKPHNVPGTAWERPNWRRRARYRLEEVVRLPEVEAILKEVNALRG
ncbi:MAG: 4-alpha-glucanotransferase [Moorellales bacterium]